MHGRAMPARREGGSGEGFPAAAISRNSVGGMRAIPIFVINLDKQPERHSYMMAALGALDLDFIRVSAVDGSELTAERRQRFSVDRSGYHWAAGEVGCLLSHASIWQRMVDEAIPLAVIFEDDIRIARKLPDFLARLGPLPRRIHALKLETLNTSADIDQRAAGVVEDVKICRLRSKHLGSAGYLLTLDGARAFLRVTRAPRRPVDHHMFDPLLEGHRHLAIYQAVPALVVQRGLDPAQDVGQAMFSSVIDATNSSRHHKPMPLGKKLKRELIRPWRQLRLATRRLWLRWRHGATAVVVPFAGDGVLDGYIAKIGAVPTPDEILAQLQP